MCATGFCASAFAEIKCSMYLAFILILLCVNVSVRVKVYSIYQAVTESSVVFSGQFSAGISIEPFLI